MNSNEAVELLELYLLGELSDSKVTAVETWLRDDPAAAKALAEAKGMVNRLDEDLQSPVGADELATKIIESLDTKVVRRNYRHRKVFSWVAGFAAAAIVLLSVTTLLIHRPAAPAGGSSEVLSGRVVVNDAPITTVSAGSAISVAGETPAIIRLTDGSQAELEPGTSAVLHGRAKGRRQLVELVEGGGTFRVEKAQGDFRVETTLGSVTAVGTEFSVRILPDRNPGDSSMKIHGAMLAVSVLTGTVQVEFGAETFTLNGGENRVFAAEQKSTVAMIQNSEKATPQPSVKETLGCQISVVSPAYCSNVQGNTPVTLAAPGFKNVMAKCWKQGEGFGSDSTVATVVLDAKGNGKFVFPADTYPHGPITVRISGQNGAVKDNCYLQLYNKGGVSWKEGMPKDPPSAAKGMSLVFADDFKGPLSIGADSKATYYDHKPPNGWQDFSTLRFTSFDKPNNPFSQVDSYLRIRASEKAKSSGLISSLKNDRSGITAKAPCYFECRFIAPNATGTWPAFWLLSTKSPGDELDIVEAYGGEGPREPNAFDTYAICPHCYNQGEAGKAMETKAFEAMHNPIRMHKLGIPSTWYETFHTYGCKITDTDTIYYCDNIEVGRHATFPVCKQEPLFFLVDLATGGGWPVDLSRYNGLADMYVDYVRVYQGKK